MEASLLAADAADAPPSAPEPLTEAQADEVIAAIEEMRKVIRRTAAPWGRSAAPLHPRDRGAMGAERPHGSALAAHLTRAW